MNIEHRTPNIERRMNEFYLFMRDRAERFHLSPLFTRPSSLVLRHSSFVTRPSSLVLRHSSIILRLSQHRPELNGFDHGLRIGPALTRFAECSSVIYRSADNGKSQGNIMGKLKIRHQYGAVIKWAKLYARVGSTG
jgi:hypothetical protein